jgi:hypothetical protein
MFDSAVGVASLCIAIAQFFILPKTARRKTFPIVLAGLLIAGLAYIVFEQVRQHVRAQSIADALTRATGSQPQTAEQIASRINENRRDPISSSDLEAAIERNREKGYLCSQNKTVLDGDGRVYFIRVYLQTGFGC